MTQAFIPPYPPRPSRPVATWRGFFGERARTSVYGWSEFAFRTDHLKRNILGFVGIGPIRESLIGSVETCGGAAHRKWLDRLREFGRAAR